MNDKIKDIVINCYNPYSEFDYQKLGELIIKETLQVARAGIEFGDGMEDAVYKYFGVEEWKLFWLVLVALFFFSLC